MKKNNNGFSLVELIIVIAIMAVLVGVLAPQFIKYVEQSRRSRDIQTAQEIREAVLADIADGKITTDGSMTTFLSPALSTVSEEPTVSGNVSGASSYEAHYEAASGTCYVLCGSYTLTTESGASAYKAA
jgi:type IV pilus assembly protein PilA